MQSRVIVLLVLLAATAVLAGAAGAAQPSSCALHLAEAASQSGDACLSCHGSGAGSHGHHPVDLDYAAARASRPGDLRGADEVVRRGVRIPDGQLRCATCHDGASPWAHYIALPAGASPVAPFDPGAPARDDGTADPVAARPGGEVSTKPLCVACHRYE